MSTYTLKIYHLVINAVSREAKLPKNNQPKYFRIVPAILMVTLAIACSPIDKNEKQTSVMVDTLHFEKKDYDSMRLYFNTNTLFLSTLD
jgi:hypothetical protein